MMTAKRLSSLIAIITFTDLPAGDNVDILEAGGNADEQKNIKEPGFCVEPAIEGQAEPDSDGNCQHYRNAHAGNHGKALKELAFSVGHDTSDVEQVQNRYWIPQKRRFCQTEMSARVTQSI